MAGVLDMRTARIVAGKALSIFAASLYRPFETAEVKEAGSGGSAAGRDGPARGARALPDIGDVLKIEEVAAIIGKPRRWIIRNAADLPFVTRVTRKHYMCSRVGAAAVDRESAALAEEIVNGAALRQCGGRVGRIRGAARAPAKRNWVTSTSVPAILR
ncbi:MAG TPA: hypothetical protein VNE82_16445 [Candidatus Binataceae bacterium]|nr:hypothetical protein [Candidatus Binataceae bacterium]